MGILKNAKHEEFALRIAKGEDATQAYIAVGYSAKSAMCCASRLQSDAKVFARIEEIRTNVQKAVEAQVGVTKSWVIQKLQENHDKAMQAVPVLDREGNETGEYNYQGSVANRALELIGKELGMFRDQSERAPAGGGNIVIAVNFGCPQQAQ